MSAGPWYARLARRHGLGLGLAAALLVALPTLGTGLFIDDFYHLRTIEGGPSPGTPFDSFVFATGEAEDMQRFAGQGLAAWWALPELKASFFRPLSSATMVLDRVVFGRSAVLYHAHSILWYVALAGVVALLYRRFLPPPLAVLALVLFAVDDGHLFAAGWWSNRNALVAGLPALLGLAAHLRWREDGWRPGLPLSLAGFALGFLGGESALGVMGYLGAYELFGRTGRFRGRVAALLPAATLSVVYLVAYRLAGRGAHGLGIYYDPFGEPGAFFADLPARLCQLLSIQFFMLPSELALLRPALAPAMAALGMAGASGAVYALARVLRTLPPEERRRAGWWLWGALLSCGPILATYPSVRNMLIPSLGGAVGVALLVRAGWRVWGRRPWRTLAVVMVALHLVLTPLVWAGFPVGIRLLARLAEPAVLEDFPLNGVPMAGKTAYAVHVAEPFAAWYPMVVRPQSGYAVPDAWHVLCMAPCDVRMTRESESAFVLQTLGDTFLSTAPEQLLRAPTHPLATGDRVELPGLTATVLSLRDGRPDRVRFDLGRPLEDETVVLLAYEGLGLRVLTPPAVGEGQVLSTGWRQVGPADLLRRVLGGPAPAPG